LRLIVPRWAREQAVRDKVRLLFLELGVTETRDRSGVLIYLSELERRVEVLGDRGIYEQLGREAWQKLVGELTKSIHGGRAAEGLTRLIEQLGAELVARFPVRPGDTNELPNEVITDRA
jgi:putative membrane protein